MMRVNLGDVAKESRETINGSKNGLPIVGLEHLTPGEITLTEWDIDCDNTFTKVFRKGQILFGRRRAYLKKAAVAPFNGICSGDITLIEVLPDKLLPELLPFIIQNDTFFDYAVGKSAGSLSPRAKWEHLSEFEFTLPPLAEQRKLADLFWAANFARETYKKLLAATDALVKSRFVEMFGDVFYGSEKYEKAPITTLIDENIDRVGKVYNSADIIKYIDISSIDNLQSEIVQYKDYSVEFAPSRAQQVVRQGDVLISTVRPNLKNVSIIRDGYENLVASTGFCVLRPSYKSNAEYIFAVVGSNEFAEYLARRAKGANYPAVNGSDIKEFMIPLPPLDLQNRFADFVRQTDKSKFELQRTIDELEATYKSLLRENLG